MSSANSPQPEEIEILADNGSNWQPNVGGETIDLLNHLSIPIETSAVIRDEAARVLSRCVPPANAAGQDTGLVVGYVQSGKTMSFTTVAALARDNGYAMVIVIAGTSKPLTEQSRQRLRSDLRINTRQDRSWVLFHNPQSTSQQDHTRITTTLADWRDASVPHEQRRTVLVTVMKNHRHLTHLINVLSQVDLSGLPVLIIDDEADQAGLNNLINDGEESTTYEKLCTLKNKIPHHTFLQYTATPQGPLLINIIDVLSPGFAVTLTPGSAYTGGQQFFGNTPLIRIIPNNEIPTAQNQLTGPPETLVEAMRLFFLGVASGIIRTRGTGGNRSMMVHPSQRTGGHEEYFKWVAAIRGAWRQTLEGGGADAAELLEDFQPAYADLAATVADIESFEDLSKSLILAIRRTELWLVNATGGRTPEIDWRASYSHILVGGQALDRGYTVEGLTVTYMPRGVGTRRADTIQQRARFFGYKMPYLGYCRVFLEQAVSDAFTRYVQHEQDIRTQLESVAHQTASLDDLRRTFLLPRGLYATRDSVIDVAYVRVRVNHGWFYPRAPQESPEGGVFNRSCIDTFLDTLEMVVDEGHESRTETQRHQVAEHVSLQEVYENLLLGLRFATLNDAQNFLGTLVVLRNHLRDNPNATCSIYEMSQGGTRQRTLGQLGRIPNLFQGAAPVNPPERRGEVYPGDREIHSPNDVTIQIHRLDLLDRDSGLVAFENISNVAIWIPPDLPGDVLIQDQGGPPEEEGDE
jgi:hypothetical protein